MPDEIVKVDGAGSGTCHNCRGKLDFSWVVRYVSGKVRTFCSLCLPK